MGVTFRQRILALGLLACLIGGPPAAAAGRNGFIRFEGIAGDGGDATHPGWFASQFLEVSGLGSGASVSKGGGGTGSVWLAGGGPGFDALVRACLSHRSFSSADVALGPEGYVLEGVALDGIQIFGASASSGASAGKGAVVVTFRFTSLRDAHAPAKPTATTHAGSLANLAVAPLVIVPTPTPSRPK
jgi:hypothetical protein